MTLELEKNIQGDVKKNNQTNIQIQRCGQRFLPSGRYQISKKAWAVRLVILFFIAYIGVNNLMQGLELGDSLVIYSTIMPIHALLVLCIGWFFYKNPAKGKVGNELVSVIIPVYNQKSMVRFVIEAIYQSTYQNLEVIAVNDGSKDGTKEILDELAKKYPSLKVIHKKNEGKRKAVAAGFYSSTGRYIALIDSDSIVDNRAITEIMKTFNANPQIGAIVGNAKIWNIEKSFLAKCQDAWYDFAFNVHKTTESVFGNVLCCSGCLAGYRRETIENFIPYWSNSNFHLSDDRELTTYAIASPWARKELSSLSQIAMMSASKYDDSEDRLLTAQSLVNWKAVYVPSAIVYTDAPEKLKGFFKQQIRWKRGTVRTNFFVTSFFWKKNPIMSFLFYVEFMTTFTLPVIILTVLIYEPLILKNFWLPMFFAVGHVLTGVIRALDYKFRDRKTKTWLHHFPMVMMEAFVLPWLAIPALWGLKRNEWLTR